MLWVSSLNCEVIYIVAKWCIGFMIWNVGFLQEWLAWAWVWSYATRRPKIDRRIRDHTHVRHWIKPFKVVGLSSSNCDSHMLQTSLLYRSQVQGKSISTISNTLCQENHPTTWEKTFFQENAIIPFTKASTPPFTLFSRWPWFSTPLEDINHKLINEVLHAPAGLIFAETYKIVFVIC